MAMNNFPNQQHICTNRTVTELEQYGKVRGVQLDLSNRFSTLIQVRASSQASYFSQVKLVEYSNFLIYLIAYNREF